MMNTAGPQCRTLLLFGEQAAKPCAAYPENDVGWLRWVVLLILRDWKSFHKQLPPQVRLEMCKLKERRLLNGAETLTRLNCASSGRLSIDKAAQKVIMVINKEG